MQHVVTGMFDSDAEAERAKEKLISAGVDRSQIRIIPGAQRDQSTAQTEADKHSAGDEGGFWKTLKNLFLPEEDHQTYAEALSRGAVMLSIQTDERRVSEVEDILESCGAVDMQERETSWRAQGWTGYTGAGDTSTLPPTRMPQVGSSSQNVGRSQSTTPQEESIPVVEERLTVGKRLASEGRVRVRSYVVNTPVQEQVRLREDNVQIERRSVNRPAGTAERAFQDRTIEAEAKREEPVVAKDVRVKEEVTLKKQPKERTETVADTVRHTEVKVEDERRQPSAPGRSGV
jgi:uncharacterized protein (TIGR02271 family)